MREGTVANGAGDPLVIQDERAERSRIYLQGTGPAALAGIIRDEATTVVMVADRAVRASADDLVKALQARGVRVLDRLDVSAGETLKSLASLGEILSRWAVAGVTREVALVAVGGGCLTDLAGYAAASFLRGIRWVAVPTTLLAQVDAAIGGKVAVNLPEGKNLVGAFHQPRVVYINPEELNTLPPREWRTGLGEVVKSALIEGGPLFQELRRGIPPIGRVDDRWRFIVTRTAAIKVEIVQRDPTEQGDRIFLNVGHTVGHALEQLTGYGTWNHGEAVAVGTLVALILSEFRLGLDPSVRGLVTEWLRAWGLPLTAGPLTYAELEPVLRRDKKARQSGIRWVLLERPGVPRVVSDVPPSMVEEALGMVRGSL